MDNVSSIGDRASRGEGAEPAAQTSMDEVVVENSQLEGALEKRERAKAHKAQVTKTFKQADDEVKALLGGMDVEVDAPIRVGMFRIVKRTTKGHAVAFETSPSERLFISPVASEE